jgi:hypothetical protein
MQNMGTGIIVNSNHNSLPYGHHKISRGFWHSLYWTIGKNNEYVEAFTKEINNIETSVQASPDCMEKLLFLLLCMK